MFPTVDTCMLMTNDYYNAFTLNWELFKHIAIERRSLIMTLGYRSWSLFIVAVLAVSPLAAFAADSVESEKTADAKTVEFFKAMKDGEINVKMIQKNSAECRVIVENKTTAPLRVQMPVTFAGVPVVAQFGEFGGDFGGDFGGPGGGSDYGGSGGRNSDSGRGNSNQSTGGGFGGMGGMSGGYGGGMGGYGGGMWNIAPEKSIARNFDTVCLEFGKKEPRSSIEYAIRPLDEVTKNPAVHEVCRVLANGKVKQSAAQLAAWHLNNKISWDELASLKITHLNGNVEQMFHPLAYRDALDLTNYAVRKAAELEKKNKAKQVQTSMAD